ncbi:cell filamentation protein Fic [Mariniphaga sediminis]|uniref:Cell filamentation protein Fic n=1 Tax=Mariniphaga sediminis TaxID=1628158 RepID=A0A399D6I9_9BACT|nr:Fic family protein [Mariniphaga sediminis]RIH67167.1 cell filamentation protein Fic [Mariniphaga sediminis]
MASPSEKLAQSLEQLQKLQNEKGIAVVRANDLSRTHKERLIANGFLREVIKGWYISTRPDEQKGDTTSWYISFWYFVSVYLNARFGKDWCLSPEQSLLLHSRNRTVPKQLLVRSPKAQNNVVELLHGTSFYDLKVTIPPQTQREEIEGNQVYSLASGLVFCSAGFFSGCPTDARICLSMIKNPSELLSMLLNGGHTIIAGRLAGAFRNIGNNRFADEIVSTMKSAGYDVRENDPFKEKNSFDFGNRETSPYATRIRLMWNNMRETVIKNFPDAPGLPADKKQFLEKMEEKYISDAYHSLSIEGYQVSPELVELVRSGKWNPNAREFDNRQKDAMAARGYWQAFQKVKESIREVLNGENPGAVADKDHGAWYRELFAPAVTAGIIKVSDLAGYRNSQVYIKGATHVPPNAAAVRDAMPVLFELLQEEPEPAVRTVMGHFVFVYIHPYMDGNGRIGRFLMNVMLASGGYPWTVIPVEKRDDYLSVLEKASVNQEIEDFAKFIARLVAEVQ